jgi:VanZ family protein
MRWVRAWLPLIIWAAVISGFSTGHFSSEKTAVVFLPLLRWLFPHARAATLDELHFLIRKSAHLSEYFVFGLLALRALRAGREQWRWTWAVEALAISAAMAALDEFHQWFVPGRTASPWDSLLDTCGAAIGLLVAWMTIKSAREDQAPLTPDIHS